LPEPPEMDKLTKIEEMEDKNSPSVSGDILLPGQRRLPERENSWTCSDFLFQTYHFGLQRWEGKK